MGTLGAEKRRKRSYYFEKYCQGRGIDIGCQITPLLPLTEIDGYDQAAHPGVITGDATHMEGIQDESYDFVYSSNCLEDIEDVNTALKNWWRILKPGGHLLLFLPHRDYYEQKRTLPSVGNQAHLHFFHPFESDPPDTLSLYDLIRSNLDDAFIIYMNECCDYIPVHRAGDILHGGPQDSPCEWCIEAVVQKGHFQPIFERNYERPQ